MPLHVGDNKDKGGNETQIRWFDEGSNMHRIWDSGMMEKSGSTEDYWAAALAQLDTESNRALWMKGTVEEWATESLEAARAAYIVPGTDKRITSGQRLSGEYLARHGPVVRTRLAQAGVRLAWVLNHAFAPTQAGVELTASESHTIQPGGPRSGDGGSKYFNIEGKGNDKYASFGILVFVIPQGVQHKKPTNMTLTLVQSIPGFAKDGALRFFLAPDLDAAHLKFDPSAEDGIGAQIKNLEPLGAGNFKKVETGKSESFSLTVNDAARQRIAQGGKLCLVIVPADANVAATYFGATESAKDRSPRVVLDVP
jgi:hypothetical protein